MSIIETLARTGESDDALAEATDFLRRHPDSERRAEIARVAGDLYRARGDYRRAVGAYQIAVGAARTRDVAEAASFHRAACLVRLGDAPGVDVARAYLRAYPAGRFRNEAAALVAGTAARPRRGDAREAAQRAGPTRARRLCRGRRSWRRGLPADGRVRAGGSNADGGRRQRRGLPDAAVGFCVGRPDRRC